MELKMENAKFHIEWTNITVTRIYEGHEVCCCGHRHDLHDHDLDTCMICWDWCSAGFNEPPVTWEVASSEGQSLDNFLTYVPVAGGS